MVIGNLIFFQMIINLHIIIAVIGIAYVEQNLGMVGLGDEFWETLGSGVEFLKPIQETRKTG
jgi:hypothetical protein